MKTSKVREKVIALNKDKKYVKNTKAYKKSRST